MISKVFYSALTITIALMWSIQAQSAENLVVSSPDQALAIEFILTDGIPKYRVLRDGVEIITPSSLGFRFKDQADMVNNLALVTAKRHLANEKWQRVWGPSKDVSNHYHELSVVLKELSAMPRTVELRFRAYNDGVAFRYLFPQQPHLDEFAITSEETEFALAGEHTAWWIPADYDSYEALYRKTPLSQVQAVNTPITLQAKGDLFLSIHEAALTDYADMTLVKKAGSLFSLTSDLVPWPDGIKVKGKVPFKTPWRTIQVAKTAGGLIESDLIENLNEPSVIADTSWIKPMKYIGIWWGMHMRKYTWEAGPKHGATTENTKAYIDFAKQHGIEGVLVEGWNKGWETWHTGINVQDFTQAYDDFDLAEVVAYGKKNGVSLIGHHETGGNIPMYEAQLEEAFALYKKLGVTAIKTGYAGKMIPEGTFHHGQQMVNHYRHVVELAAKNNIMLNAHEPIKDTGIRRTYPNMMTREGGRGMEWNGWSEGNSPEHTVTLPFTRLLAGPMDYTPGIFNIKFDPQEQYRVHTTLAKQLAMYVVLYSPMQMAADMIENYQQQPAFEFIEHVPTTWDESKVLAGEIGDYISIARREGEKWFIGSMTDEVPRTLKLTLDFLAEDTTYITRIFSDAKATDFHENPTAIDINSYQLKKGDELIIAMASGGGQALYLTPIPKNEPTSITKLAIFNQLAQQNENVFAQGRQYGEIQQVSHLAVNKKVIMFSEYDQGYSAGGDQALVDGLLGNADYRSLWQGYRKKDLNLVIDLGEPMSIKTIEIGFLKSQLHSILLPSQVSFALSDNGQDFDSVDVQSYHTKQQEPDYQRKQFKVSFPEKVARYIRVHAVNLSKLPDWHVRAGQETFIFADEIQVH